MSMRQIFAEQYVKLPVLVNSTTCLGKTYIVTGSNNGLGLETARHLVGASASCVVLAVRNLAAGEKAKADIECTTRKMGVVQVWHLDLSSSESVKRFAAKAEAELVRIDGLIENAGVMLDTWTLAEGGMEMSMTVNVINTMFLGMLMLPKMMARAKTFAIQPRIVFLVSGLAFQNTARRELEKVGKVDVLGGLNNQKKQAMNARYALTKLVETYAVRAFAAAYPFEKTQIVINMVSPGICTTRLARDTSIVMRAAQGVIRTAVARTAEQGSRTILHALLADETTQGKHLSGCKVKEDWIQPWMTNADGQKMQKQIWKELVALTEWAQPGFGTKLS
ncbi:NAD(P)-binding protein [Setomelanomma holmii]|uniref:NAD(P)-binding protein n=1 Tax=Setomelanomma holmii TaxID=210430 RepID=A0A9P4LJP5_9PLEO|nr:NAD(P)-binding protein [Setomelanomma holmii]